MAESNKINPLTRTWPTQPMNKDKQKDRKNIINKKDDTEDEKDNSKDPGDTIIDEYV